MSKAVTPGARPCGRCSSGGGVEIRDGAATHFVHLGEMRVAIVQGATTRFVHSNYLGSTSFFTDAAGTKIASIAYRPFGNVSSTTGAVDLRTYGAHPFDEESGLFYMRRRYYAPELGALPDAGSAGVVQAAAAYWTGRGRCTRTPTRATIR